MTKPEIVWITHNSENSAIPHGVYYGREPRFNEFKFDRKTPYISLESLRTFIDENKFIEGNGLALDAKELLQWLQPENEE